MLMIRNCIKFKPEIVETGDHRGVEESGDRVRVVALAQMEHNADQVEGQGHHEDALEVPQVRLICQVEKQVFVLGKVPAHLLVHFRLDKVLVVVDKEHGRGEIVANIPQALHSWAPLVGLAFYRL